MKKDMKRILILTAIAMLFVGCEKNNANTKDDEIVYNTIIGNTYIAKDRTFSDNRTLFLIYEFKPNGDLTIQERLYSENGELYMNSFGYFEYKHPTLELEINSMCDKCFNYFTATVANDYKSFKYSIYDISISSSRELVFNIKERK